ncbi:hypothetical protein [Klebsiella pneumoniae]|uniref:hypothetical protein n=1 Tax=Klebsiella pneumoniae TaxID=573 RepID=UPI00237F9200|nr:hypothetical protein [Klebsiella pneumoniae]
MSNLPEQVSWESGIHQLEEADRAKAGPGGVLNIQANQLANRTRWLRALVESAQDYREYTFYKSESDLDGTIAGLANTPAGKIFRVAQGLNDDLAFIYYLNDSGIAVALTALLGRGAIINNVREYPTITLAQNDTVAGNILDGAKCWVTNSSDSALADEYINNGGTLEPTGRKMPSGAAVELMSDTVQRLMTALHVMAEGGTSSGSGIESSDTVQNLMTGFNVLAESINNLSVGNQQNASGLSRLVSSVQICTEMLNTLAAEIVTPDGAAQYGYVAFSVPGTVNAGNGSFGTDTRYRRTGMIPVRKGDVVRLTVYTTSATAGHAAALYDSSGAYVGPLGIMCASYAAYQARYYQCEIAQDGFVVANTLDQSASSSADVTGAVLTIDHRLRGRAADAVLKLHRQPQATQLRCTIHQGRTLARWGLCARRMRRIRHGITSVKLLRMALLSRTRWTRARPPLLMSPVRY